MKSVSNKLFIAFLVGLLYIPCFSQTIIQMEEYGGVYRIPCKVNGAKMKLIFDTGAESVCLSMSMAEYLLDNDYLDKSDIVGTGTSSVADGRIVDHVIVNIKDIEIQDVHLFNIKAVVIDGQNAPLLLGQSAIQQLGPIEINGNILTIRKGDNNSDELINRLFEEANQAYDNKMYGRASEKYAKLYALNKLSDYGIFMYANSCWFNNNPKKAKELLNEINDFEFFEENKIDIYRMIGHICCELNQFEEAIRWYELSNKKIQAENSERLENLLWIADCYYYDNDYSTAVKRYSDVIDLLRDIYNIDFNYFINDCENKLKKNEKSLRKGDLGDLIDKTIFRLFYSSYEAGLCNFKTYLIKIAALARANNRYAIKYCNDLPLDPYDSHVN